MKNVKYGNPRSDRTVVHLINIPRDEAVGGDKMPIGKIGDDGLWLSFEVRPLPLSFGPVKLTYTFYVDAARK